MPEMFTNIKTVRDGVVVHKIFAVGGGAAALDAEVEAFREDHGDWRGIVTYVESDPNVTRQGKHGGDIIVTEGEHRWCAEMVSVQDIIDGKVG